MNDYESLVGRQVFASCHSRNRAAQGNLVCTKKGFEFTSDDEHLVIAWSDISEIEIIGSFRHRMYGLASLNVFDGTTLFAFDGREVSDVEYLILGEIAEIFKNRISNDLEDNYGSSKQLELGDHGAGSDYLRQHLPAELWSGSTLLRKKLVDVVDATGWAPPVGTKVSVQIDGKAITLSDPQSKRYVLPLSSLSDIRVEGYTSKTNFGMIGGGFGVKGAVEGMAIAATVNRLTTKVKTWVIVWIESTIGRLMLLILSSNATEIRRFFRPAQDRAIAMANSPHERESNDLVSALERLTALYEKNLLSEEEFAAMKKKLLQ